MNGIGQDDARVCQVMRSSRHHGVVRKCTDAGTFGKVRYCWPISIIDYPDIGTCGHGHGSLESVYCLAGSVSDLKLLKCG